MIQRFIPILPAGAGDASTPPRQELSWVSSNVENDTTVLLESPVSDRFGRPLHDLRISVTDRCNFRCSYCMPRAVFDRNHVYLPQSALLRFEEITRLASRFVALGVRKIRLTGGEPLLRRGLTDLIAQLAALRDEHGRRPELALTTNGVLLKRMARPLRDAGLDRVTVSLDALDDGVFRQMNDADFGVSGVLEGIQAAHEAGLGPVKVNTVVRHGLNADQVIPLARHFRGSGVILRFIEYMDVGMSNGWQHGEVVPSRALVEMLDAAFGIEPVLANYTGEVAERWRYTDGQGEVGFISSVTQPFCQDCSRARLSTEGKLYHCLFAHKGYDLRSMLRGGATDHQIDCAIAGNWAARTDRYSEQRSERPTEPGQQRIEMSYIGG